MDTAKYPVGKSKAAFRLSVATLFKQSNQVFLWTFTWPTVMPDWRYSYSWASFIRHLCHFYGNNVQGLRVVEVHPGGHGLHYHALLNRRLDVRSVRMLCKRHGLGRVHVQKADEGSAVYLSKYLSKENQLSKGMRAWGTIGGFKGTKVCDIRVESVLTDNIRWAQDKLKIRQFSYAFTSYIYRNSMLYGSISEWPLKKVRTIDIRNAKAACAKDVREDLPDDDGVTYHDLNPLQTSLDKKKWITVPGPFGASEVAIAAKVDEPY